MSAWSKQWVENEYIRISLLADHLLGKEKIVDFYYGNSILPKEETLIQTQHLIQNLDELLKITQKHLDDTPPFYRKTIFQQQISSVRNYLEHIAPYEQKSIPLQEGNHKKSDNPKDYIHTVEALLGIKPTPPNYKAPQQALKNSLEAAGYSGPMGKMLTDWQDEGDVDLFTFIEETQKIIPLMWDEVRNKVLRNHLSDEEIDFLQETSQVKFFYLDNIWEDWPYYGGYRGVYLSMIGLNARLRWNRYNAKAFLAYEVIPGRHLFWIIRQRYYDLNQFSKVGMLSTFASPERLIQEGIIACAHEFLWPEGLKNPKEQIALDYRKLQRSVGLAAAIKLYQEKEDSKRVQAFIQNQAFLTPGKAKALIGIIQEHPYHYPTVQSGYELIKEIWQEYGESFWVELAQYRCPDILKRLYPLDTAAKGEQKVV